MHHVHLQGGWQLLNKIWDLSHASCNMQCGSTSSPRELTNEQRLRIENNRQEALARKRRTLELKQQQQQQQSIVITEELRARIERNRLLALEKKRQHLRNCVQPSLLQSAVPSLLQSSSISQIAQNDTVNIINQPAKRQKTYNNYSPDKCKQTPPAKRQKTQPTYQNKRYKNCSSSLTDKCKYCKNEMHKHKAYFGNGLLMCKLSGYYRCSCRNAWWGSAFKVTHTSKDNKKAFPKYTFPDCRKCKSNNTVKLVKYKLNDSLTNNLTRPKRGHQHQFCPLCKRGRYCPRAHY